MEKMEELERIAERFGLRDVYVFGSRAKEVAARVRGAAGTVATAGTSSSDVDLAVQPVHELDARGRVRLMAALEDLLGVPRVDLVILGKASPSLAVEIVRGELLLTRDPRAQAEHELYVLRRAADLAHLRRERTHAILHGGAR